MAVARDKFWIFGVRAHQDDGWLGTNWESRREYQLRASRITPVEAAHMLDVPNMFLITCDGIPVPFSEEAYGYAESFCRMEKVYWGASGAGGFRIGNEQDFICKLADEYPNICGAFLDDFFGKKDAPQIIKEIRDGLDKASRHLEIYSTWYPLSEAKEQTAELIDKYVDGLTIWTWNSDDLVHLEEGFEKIEKQFPNKKKLLGIYMFDFPNGRPLTEEQMEHQCELGLKWLKEGRLDGMIFEANSVMGVRLKSEKWLRQWVEKVKYTEIPD